MLKYLNYKNYTDMEREERQIVNEGQIVTEDQTITQDQAITEDQTAVAVGEQAMQLPPMPVTLPPLIELLVSKVEPRFRPAVACSVFPPLAIHMKNYSFMGLDGREGRQCVFYSVLVAETGSGKSCVDEPIKIIIGDIAEADKESMEKEREWMEVDENREHIALKPHFPIQILPDDSVSSSAFIDRLCAAEGRYIYVKTPEIETLYGIADGKRDKIATLFKKGFDNDQYGHMRSTSKGYTGIAPLRWMCNASTTPSTALGFFGRGKFADGTGSRVDFCTIVQEDKFARRPKVKRYNNSYKTNVKPYIDRLKAVQGELYCEELYDFMGRLDDEIHDIFKKAGDQVGFNLAHRAMDITLSKAIVLYYAHGEWTPAIEDFLRWSVMYHMAVKLNLFGENMEEELAKDAEIMKPKKQVNYISRLPKHFTVADIEALYRADHPEYTDKEIRTKALAIGRSWVHEGKITGDRNIGWTKVDK